MKTTTKAILGTTAVIGTALAAGSEYFYRFAVKKRKDYNNIWAAETRPQPYEKLHDADREKVQRGINFIFESGAEEVYIDSIDGLRLCGHLIQHPNPNGLIIMVHGYRSNPSNDFSGAVLPFREMGFSLLLIDHRAHGNSQGDEITFGVKERYDLLGWCRAMAKRFPYLPIVLDGVSMGAATVMMAAGLDLPQNVRALICDCGYTSPAAICKTCLKKWFNLPAFPLFYTANLVTKLRSGFGFNDADSREGLANCRIPVLIAHGTGDDFVPYWMGEQNIAACTGCDAEFFTVHGAEHGMCFIVDAPGYMARIKALFAKAGIPWNESVSDES